MDARAPSYAATGSALAKMLATLPHSAHRKADEAPERKMKKCPVCGGLGFLKEGDGRGFNDYPPCWRCDGTGEIVTDEPEQDTRPIDPFEGDWLFERDNDRYLADLNGEDE